MFSLKRYKQLRQANLYQLYYKQRTSECRKICDATPGKIFFLNYNDNREIPPERWLIDEDAKEMPQTRRLMNDNEYKIHIQKEGFKDVNELYNWFNKNRKKGEKISDTTFMIICFKRVI